MNKFRKIFCLLVCFVLPSMQGISQDLRIDFKRINSEKAKQKTNGDYMNYLEKEVQSLEQSYKKTSKEYVYLKEFYLDEYHKIYQPYATLNPISIKEYTEGRKELVQLCAKVYGDTSVQYAEAIAMHIINFTSLWNESLSDSSFQNLLLLSNKAINITTITPKYTEDIKFGFLSELYSEKGDLFKKIGIGDSALKYYDKVLEIKKSHPLYNASFPSFLCKYANAIDDQDEQKGLDFLIKYLPLVKEKYSQSGKENYFSYLTSILSHYLRTNYIDKQAISYLLVADTLCMNLYGELSNEYTNYTLDYKLSAFKKMGWKSMVYQELANLNDNVLSQNKKLLSQNQNFFLRYHLEWFYYYQSVNDENSGLKWLRWADRNVIDSNLNRNSFSSKIEIYRELGNYYRFKNFDSCLNYSIKILNLELKAKQLWGDYVIHQYVEIAKLMVNAVDTPNYELANKFCILAAVEFKDAYGLNSSYYKSAMFTHGKLLFKTGSKSDGLKEMTPMVYENLDDNKFVPPLNTSIFQSYGDFLNQADRYDSADFFYNQIYLRNNGAQVFRILGSSGDYQLKSLQDIYTQNYLILTQHFRRCRSYKYDFVSTDLAEQLFKKNLIYQIQAYTNEAIKNAFSEQDINAVRRIEKDKKTYDSLLYSVTPDLNFIDSAYGGLDLDKNWLLQSYILNKSMDSSSLIDLKREYSYKEIQKSLLNGECFIDIVRFLMNDQEFGFSLDPYYAIVLVDKTSNEKLKYFFIEDGLRFEDAVIGGDINKVSSLLLPLIDRLRKYNKVYVNPDGAFNLLNFYSLKDGNDEYLIKDKTFVYINTISGITDSADRPQNNNFATFFGNPLFNTKSVSNTGIQRKTVFPFDAASNFRELPYTKIEIETASETLKNKGWRIKKFIGVQCNEEQLKNVIAPGILHIATHGFYISELDTAKRNFAFKSNPYLRSGLILGSVSSNGKNLNDNVLTAYEVMDLNLKTTSLVVLSACESAKGELKPGQGVYGLQRAFKIAGAKNVLVSVRNVDDKATQILMQYFYENVAAGNTYTISLRNAQLNMLNHPLFNDPKYWSNFILIGQ